MDKSGNITSRNNVISSLAVDGLLYGLIGGIVMISTLALLALAAGELPAALLERFGTGEVSSPIVGLISHLAVSAIYGILFGVICWPVLARYAPGKMLVLMAGLAYSALLLLLAQTAILPNANSSLSHLPIWQWTLGHGVYGLVLGSAFAKKVM